MFSNKCGTVNETGNFCARFQARPMPDFSKVKGVPPKRAYPLTDPESPAIKRRRVVSPRSEKRDTSFVAGSVPNFDKMFQVNYPDRPMLVPQPFSFEEREKNKPSKKNSSNEVFVFSARPMPDFSKTGLPPRAVSSPVKPMPFQLRTDIRGEKYAAQFKRELEEKKRQEKLKREFRAKKNVSSLLYGKPFVPEKSKRPALCVDNFVLRTELRSQERSKFDSQKFHRSCLLEASNLERKALREAEEAKEIAGYRKTLVHKPLPIGSSSPAQVKSAMVPIVHISPIYEPGCVQQNRQY